MGKLDIWRWAQYTLLGLLATSLIIFTIFPDRGQGFVAKITPKEVLPVTLAIVAFGAYIVGMMLWVVTVTLHKVVTWPVFAVFRKLGGETRNYRDYRMMELRKQAKVMKEGEADVPNDIPDYTHFLLELYRSSATHPQHLGGKIISGWQSCTLMLSILGCLMLGAVFSLGRIVVMLFISWQDALKLDLYVFVGLTVLYLLAGLASLERNRILVRDVLMSYVLRREKNVQSGSDE